MWPFYESICLKIRTYKLLFLVVHNSLLCSWFPSLSGALYKLSDLQVYLNNVFISMLNRLLFIVYLQAPIRYTHILLHSKYYRLQFIIFYLTLYIDICIFLTCWLGGVMLASIWPHAGSIKLLVTHHLLKIIFKEKETRTFCVDRFIICGLFLGWVSYR